MLEYPNTSSAALRLLHGWAGTSGYDLRIDARTDHDELSEFTRVSVQVCLPAEGRVIAEADERMRETSIDDVLVRVVLSVLRKVEVV